MSHSHIYEYCALQAIVRATTAAANDVRSAMARIAVEEASHAALSARIAAWLDTQLSVEEREQVAQAKRVAISDLRGELACEPSPALRKELGLPSRSLALSLMDALETKVWRQAV